MKRLATRARLLLVAGSWLGAAVWARCGEPCLDIDAPGEWGAIDGAPSEDPAVVPYVAYTFDYFHNVSGGIQTGGAGMGLLDVGFEADLEKLVGLGGASFFVSAFAGHGSDFSANYAGDFGVASNIYHGDDFNFYNIYLRQALGGHGSYLKVGQIAADDDFMGVDAAGYLINSVFGPFNTQSGNMGAPIFPFAAPGAVLHYAPVENWSLTLGIYAGASECGEPDNRGFDWRWGGGAGQAVFAETGFVYNDAGGVFKLGGFYHTGEFEDFSSEDIVDGLGAVYFMVNHPIINGGENGPGVTVFLRGSVVTKEDRAVATGYIDAGLSVDDLVRTGDAFAFGVSHTVFGDAYLKANPGVTDTETVIEATYRFPLTDYLSVQPDIQYVFNAHDADRDAFLLGVRATLEF